MKYIESILFKVFDLIDYLNKKFGKKIWGGLILLIVFLVIGITVFNTHKIPREYYEIYTEAELKDKDVEYYLELASYGSLDTLDEFIFYATEGMWDEMDDLLQTISAKLTFNQRVQNETDNNLIYDVLSIYNIVLDNLNSMYTDPSLFYNGDIELYLLETMYKTELLLKMYEQITGIKNSEARELYDEMFEQSVEEMVNTFMENSETSVLDQSIDKETELQDSSEYLSIEDNKDSELENNLSTISSYAGEEIRQLVTAIIENDYDTLESLILNIERDRIPYYTDFRDATNNKTLIDTIDLYLDLLNKMIAPDYEVFSTTDRNDKQYIVQMIDNAESIIEVYEEVSENNYGFGRSQVELIYDEYPFLSHY